MNNKNNSSQWINALQDMHQYNEEYTLKSGRQRTAFVQNYGCQQNAADAQTLEGLLLDMGYSLATIPEVADVVLYNTCAVREHAEDRVFGNVGAIKEAKEKNPEMIIGICGCMTQQKHIAERIRSSYPFVDLVFGAGAMHTLPKLLLQKIQQPDAVYNIENPTREIMEELPVHRTSTIKAFVPIMTGCDNFCSYCVVPFVRGRERSRPLEVIRSDVEILLQEGFKEITLLGQNVNSYGKGLDPQVTFSQLLAELAVLPYHFRLRFMTSHPKDCSMELIDTMAKYPNITQSIHLPVQSGSNKILQAMNREYTVEDYLKIIQYAKHKMPHITFTSDIIIGFPGETEDDFVQTLKLVDMVGYSAIFTFAYSPRAGTKAAQLSQTLTQQQKTEWFERILALQRKKANTYHQSLLGSTLEVLVESIDEQRPGYAKGHTNGNVIVLIQHCPPKYIGQFVPVTICNYYNWALEGVITLLKE